MSWVGWVPIQTWKCRVSVVPNTLTSHWTTIHWLTPSVRVPTLTPGAPVPFRSVQKGASTLFGRAEDAPDGSVQHSLSSEVAPPTTR